MVATECLDDCSLDTFVFRVGDNHVEPGDRLKQRPMQSNRYYEDESDYGVFEFAGQPDATIQTISPIRQG